MIPIPPPLDCGKTMKLPFIRITTPDGDAWSDQEHYIRVDLIVGLRWCKKLTSPGSPENGVEVTVQNDRSYGSNHFWIRCTSTEAAQALYENIISQIEDSSNLIWPNLGVTSS